METQELERIRIGTTDIILEEISEGQGKIIVSDPYMGSYSHYWGAMGSPLPEFLNSINKEYFAQKLLDSRSIYEYCPKKTMTNIRKWVKEWLPYYKHMEFQKHMREEIKSNFQHIESSNQFIYAWDRFVGMMDYDIIEDRWDMDEVKESFKGVSEPWHFIGERTTRTYKWMTELHGKLKKNLNNKHY